jgi:RNA polymerase sigma-70 factor (ECF subfamily)
MLSEEEIIKGCIAFNSAAQKALYKRYASKMYVVCIRYAKNTDEAKDLMQESFMKVYTNISKYRNEGSFEGWIRRIVINTAINYIKKNRDYKTESFNETNLDYNSSVSNNSADENDVVKEADFTEEELRDALNILPANYRIIFNLFCFENYSHKEIAKELSINEETSRVRLLRARRTMQEHLIKLSNERIFKKHSQL